MDSSPNFHHYPKVELTSTSATIPSVHGPRPQPSAPPLPEDTNTHHAESPVTGYPPVMGYPPNHGQPHILPLLPPRQPFISRRSATAVLIAVVVVVSMVSAIVRSLYQPRTPVVKVVGMSVSNFTISGGTALTADWEVNITVKNPSMRMTASIGRAPTYIYYRNILLSGSETDPLELRAKGEGRLSVSMTAEGKEQLLEDYLIIEMQMDRKNGEMSFDMLIEMSVAFHHRLWWTNHQGFRASCSIIRVGFGSGSGGNMLDAERECSVS